MVDQQLLETHWSDLKEPLQSKWGQLTDHDLLSFEGSPEKLVGLIQMRTGEAREAVENQLEEIIAQSMSVAEKVVESVRHATAQASEQIHEGYNAASEQVAESYRSVESSVQTHPVESLAVAFGSGLIAGVVIGLIARR